MARTFITPTITDRGLEVVNAWCRAIRVDTLACAEKQYTAADGKATFVDLPDGVDCRIICTWVRDDGEEQRLSILNEAPPGLGECSGDADNIAESATKKWAGETGADVTGDHEADVNLDNIAEGTTYKRTVPNEKEGGGKFHYWDERDSFCVVDFNSFGTFATVTGAASVAQFKKATLSTGATANSTAGIYARVIDDVYYQHIEPTKYYEIEWHAGLHDSDLLDDNGIVWLMLQGNETAANPSARAFGFRLDKTAAKGIKHDGTDLTVVDLSTTLDYGHGYQFKVVHIPDDKIYWYIDGSLKGSSDVFSGQGTQQQTLVMAMTNGADTADAKFYVNRIKYTKERYE